MAVSYGFYNSSNGDRRYNARDFNTLFDGIITEGIFKTIYNQFAVLPGETVGLTVRVDTGKAWLNNTWTVNDSIKVFSDITGVTGTAFSRIDAVVIEVDTSNRTNSIKYIEGSVSYSPTKPVLAGNQYPLAYVTVIGKTDPSTCFITAANIENMVGVEDGGTPYVFGMIDQNISIEQLVGQYQALFEAWFDEMKGQLTNDAATNLQKEVNDLITYGTQEPYAAIDIPGVVYFQYED